MFECHVCLLSVLSLVPGSDEQHDCKDDECCCFCCQGKRSLSAGQNNNPASLSTPVTTEPGRAEPNRAEPASKPAVPCFNLLDRSCEDACLPACLPGPMASSNLNLLSQRGRVRVVFGRLSFTQHTHTHTLVCHASSLSLSHFAFNLLVYHPLIHTHTHTVVLIAG